MYDHTIVDTQYLISNLKNTGPAYDIATTRCSLRNRNVI